MSRAARTTRPPNASPMDWWPRQTPRMGISPAKRRMAATEMPASAGVHGPGEMSSRSGRRAASLSTVMASLRNTRISGACQPGGAEGGAVARVWTML